MNPVGTNSMEIHTPEGIVFSFQVAGPISRFLAWLVDVFCILALTSLLGKLVFVMTAVNEDFGRAMYVLIYFSITIGYGVYLEWMWRGQTLGKRMLRLRVIDGQGLPLQFSQIAIRNLLRLFDSFPILYMVGGTAMLLAPRGQRLGDLAAGTVVIRQPKQVSPDLAQLHRGHYNSLNEHQHLVARLRQQVPPLFADLALQAVARREAFDPESRVRLFSEIAAHLEQYVSFPEATTHGMTDEQFVRNVVEVLFVTL